MPYKGEIVALVGGASLIRTANDQEFQVFVPPGGHSVSVECISEGGGNQAEGRDFLHWAMLDNTSFEQTEVTLQHGAGPAWFGWVTSTTNQ